MQASSGGRSVASRAASVRPGAADQGSQANTLSPRPLALTTPCTVVLKHLNSDVPKEMRLSALQSAVAHSWDSNT